MEPRRPGRVARSTAWPSDPQRLAGRYRLEHRLAAGGMAQVWAGVDEVLNRQVAVKVLHSHLAGQPDFVARFRREAHAAARLNHRHVVSIFDTVSADGVEAIVMELVEGPTLRRLIDEEGPLAPARAAALGAQVADALDAAHRAGLVHRDVKPANVLLDPAGRVVVTDFGIAKARGDEDLTQGRALVGTAKYLSPEQVDGEPVTSRSDVYALGVVLYEMLTGEVPFEADSDVATALLRVRRDPVPPRHLRPGVPRAFDELVLEMLARDPADRPATAGIVRDRLRALGDDDDLTLVPPADATEVVALGPTTGEVVVPPFRTTERGWLAPAAVVVVVAVALAVSGSLLGRTEAGRRLLDSARSVVGVHPAGTAAGSATTTAPGPPGRVLAVRAVSELDPPPGDGREHPEQLDRLLDDDDTTAWTTEGYNQRNLGKPGVGLVVELEEAAPLGRVEVRSTTRGWGAQVFVADAPGATLAEWGDPVGGLADVAGDGQLDLGGRRGQAVLVWFTDLGEPDRGRHRVEVGAIAVRAA